MKFRLSVAIVRDLACLRPSKGGDGAIRQLEKLLHTSACGIKQEDLIQRTLP